MAWNSPEEQWKEWAAGNSYAKDWHNEALKAIENTVENYWNNR